MHVISGWVNSSLRQRFFMNWHWLWFALLCGPGTLPAQATYQETCLTRHPANDRYASYAPDGRSIIFESDRSGTWDIYQMDIDGNNVRQLTQDTANNRQPSWHPDGRSVLFESDRSGHSILYWFSLDSDVVEKAVQVAVPGGDMHFGRVSPDGGSIVFTLQVDTAVFHLYLYRISDRSLRLLTIGNYRYAYANWSPDGSSLTFHARHETGNLYDEVYTLNLDTGRWKRCTNVSGHSFCPAWSADGTQIAYVQSMAESRPEIFIMRRNGKKKQQITHNSDGDTLPSWSPDGRHLLITGFRGANNFEICRIELP
ncbi:MAG: hypothetical protein EP344_08780 [Bacteroidetes bacterium]|nr:MAG: hypothetical protein EP344_08780 [Bacteroidota bacterium]